MYSLITLFLVAFTMALLVTPLCRDLALRWNLLDHPGDSRKIHLSPIPRIGGVPLVLAYLSSFGLIWAVGFQGAGKVQEHLPFILKLLPAAALMFGVGLVDDLIGLGAKQKLAGQLAASIMAVWAGARITGFAGYEMSIWWAAPLSVLWLVGFANAFNLIDGVDGLAAGVGLVATITTLVAALVQHNMPLALATVPLAGALLGFLRYNFSPASIFLGDSGSLLIGFLLGCYGLLWTQKAATVLGITAPLIAMSIPLVDTGLAIARRFLHYQPIFGADRSHIHHKLLARGFKPRRVALTIYGVCAISACLGLLQSVWREQFAGAIILLFCLGTCIFIQRLGYTEFGIAGRMVMAGSFRRLLQARLQLDKFREALNAAVTTEDCWEVIYGSYARFGFSEVTLHVGDNTYRHASNGHQVTPVWTIRIPLTNADFITLSREFDSPVSPIVGSFADEIGEILILKLQAQSDALEQGRGDRVEAHFASV